jgi:hypothetical protein
MNDNPKSKGELVIERIMQELDPTSRFPITGQRPGAT